MHDRSRKLLRRIRLILAFFVFCLVVSGLTAIPIRQEVDWLARAMLISDSDVPEQFTGMRYWIAHVREGLHAAEADYPFLAYGTDWLAFAHVIIAVAFIGPWLDPVRNRWVVTFGMIACAAVIPTALFFGNLRGIPFSWQLIDCSFGLFGILPLLLVKWHTHQLAMCEATRV